LTHHHYMIDSRIIKQRIKLDKATFFFQSKLLYKSCWGF